MLSIASLISKDGGALFYASLATAVAIHGLISIQRAHDFNTSGLLAIVAFIPFVNFIFWFVPGTKGENRFGKKTPPNSRSAIVMASILVSLMIVGIHASIFLPRR